MKQSAINPSVANASVSQRLVPLNTRRKNLYFQFTSPEDAIPRKSLNFYTQGCPETWRKSSDITPNQFKLFQTGDAFSTIQPKARLNGAAITIHLGFKTSNFSKSVCLQEAFQLCRSAREHGASSITVTLPDTLHPIAHPSDFSLLLLRLFKKIGTTRLYYYNEQFSGILKNETIQTLPIDQQQLSDYLSAPEDAQSFDEQVMYIARCNHLNEAWSLLCGIGKSNTISKPALPLNSNPPKSHILLSCSANKTLAQKIAKSLQNKEETLTLYAINGQGHEATIPKTAELFGATVTIVQSTRPNPDNHEETTAYTHHGASFYLFETLMIARQAHLRGARTINLINPYQFNARSDKAEDNELGKAGAYVQQNGRLLEASGIHRVITAECHDLHTLSGAYTTQHIQSSAIPALSIISASVAKNWLEKNPKAQCRFVAPDAGAVKRTKALAQQLKHNLGTHLNEQIVSAEKQRDSHEDGNAFINHLETGHTKLNPDDKYLVGDDETATGRTLCEIISKLQEQGAEDISVIIVHNNMPVDWLERQLCLARFLYMGVKDLHFSDTHEMGSLAKDYKHLIQHYAQMTNSSHQAVEKQVSDWFHSKLDSSAKPADFKRFKSLFNTLNPSVTIHSLADNFADKVLTKQLQTIIHLNQGDSLQLLNRTQTPAEPGVQQYHANNMRTTS